MNLAATNWLSISINLLLVIFVITCLLMVLLILMQRPKQEGLGAAFGAGVTDQVFGARTTNVLQRGTVYLASLFFLLSLTLAVLIGHQNKKTSMITSKTPVAQSVVEAPKEPAKPTPLSDQLPPETTPPVETTPNSPATVTPPAPETTSPEKTTTPTSPEEKPGQP